MTAVPLKVLHYGGYSYCGLTYVDILKDETLKPIYYNHVHK